MVKLFANSGDPDQMPHCAVSHLGLHCLSITLWGFSDSVGFRMRFGTYMIRFKRYCRHENMPI